MFSAQVMLLAFGVDQDHIDDEMEELVEIFCCFGGDCVIWHFIFLHELHQCSFVYFSVL